MIASMPGVKCSGKNLISPLEESGQTSLAKSIPKCVTVCLDTQLLVLISFPPEDQSLAIYVDQIVRGLTPSTGFNPPLFHRT